MKTMDRAFEAFKVLVPYLRGALWWAKDDLIKKQHTQFVVRDDRKGHPLLSVSKKSVENRFEAIPMLVGTSGMSMNDRTKFKCVLVSGMTAEDRDHKTYFGSIVQPGLYAIEDMMAGVGKGTTHTGFTTRNIYPNEDKPLVNESERASLEAWCRRYVGG